MPFQTRTLSFVGIAFVLALLLSAFTMPSHQASAQTAQAAAPKVSPPYHLTHHAYYSNTFGDYTLIGDSHTMGVPNAILFVTPNFDPGGSGGTYDPHPVGVWYDTSASDWAIFNEDGASMPVFAAFNVLIIPTAGGSVFVQTASTISGDSTYINNVLTNGQPSVRLLITQNFNPGGIGGTYNPHPVGVWYNTFKREWAIFNEDKTNMTSGATFNVMVGASASGGTEFLQTTTSSNRSGDSTFINNPSTNGNLYGVVLVTPNFNPGGSGGTYDPHPVGVWYATSSGQWAVLNEDGAIMPLSAAFIVLAF
jgi:hypothetical protein